MATLIGAAASGGRFIPEKPDIENISEGRFRIKNFNENLSYNLSVNSGSISKNNDEIIISSKNSLSIITAFSPKGGQLSTQIERTEYTYYTYQRPTTYSYPCTQTCTRQVTYREAYSCLVWGTVIGTCSGAAEYYGANRVCFGCPAGCYCPAGMFQSGCTCFYQCETGGFVPSTCYRDVCCRTESYSCPGTCTAPTTVTERAKNTTPNGFLDSGSDWFRVL